MNIFSLFRPSEVSYNKKAFNRQYQICGLKTFLSMISGDPKKEITFSHTDREIWRGLDLF